MNKTQIIWGVICLLVAVVLAVLIIVLPPEQFMFQLGDRNMPWVPTVALAVVGVILLATAGQKKEAEVSVEQPKPGVNPEKAALNKRLESIGWGFFLIMLGGFALVPNNMIPKGWWSIGVGVIMLGLNLARYFNKIRMSGFTIVLGILSVAGGITELLGVTKLQGAFLLIILGAYLILKPWFDKRQLLGKAEQS